MNDEIKNKILYYKERETDAYFLDDLERVLLQNNEQEIIDRFYTELEFGTGGIRGIVGAGINRLNTFIVRKVAAGWARYLRDVHKDEPLAVVIAHDSRNFSDTFTNAVSGVLCACGIRVYAFSKPSPTPQLSLAVRELTAHSGMVVTASHNPPQYNGLKIYGNDGAQLVSPQDEDLMKYIISAEPDVLGDISIKDSSYYIPLDESYDEKFHAYVRRVLGSPNAEAASKKYSVVYTPLHGTGAVHIEKLTAVTAVNCTIEPTQKNPDGAFPTVEYPNPEDPKALVNAIQTAKNIGASLVVANDPDADRMGAAERTADGDFVCLTGNQIGVLLLDYVIAHAGDTSDRVFVSTIVTTTLQEKIARAHGIDVLCGYTGFKNIAQFMRELENAPGRKRFLFGCEESYGYLASDEVRDKDGISTAMLCMQMAQEYHAKGKTLMQVLLEIYRTYGYHEERTVSKTFSGKEGKERIQNIMHMLREKLPNSIGSERVVLVYDYLSSLIRSAEKGDLKNISLPPSDVLIFQTENGNKLCVRPSGTEPKIKFYLLYCASPDMAQYETSVCSVKALLNDAEKEVYKWLEM